MEPRLFGDHVLGTDPETKEVVFDGNPTGVFVGDCIPRRRLPSCLDFNQAGLELFHNQYPDPLYSYGGVLYGIAGKFFLEDFSAKTGIKSLHQVRFYLLGEKIVPVYRLSPDGELYVGTTPASEILPP